MEIRRLFSTAVVKMKMAGGWFAYVWVMHLYCSKSLTCKSIIHSITFHIQLSFGVLERMWGGKEALAMLFKWFSSSLWQWSVCIMWSCVMQRHSCGGWDSHIWLRLALTVSLGKCWQDMSSDGNASGPSLPLHSSPHAVSADETLETRSEEHRCRPCRISLSSGDIHAWNRFVILYKLVWPHWASRQTGPPCAGDGPDGKAHFSASAWAFLFLFWRPCWALDAYWCFRGRVLHLLNQ